MKKHAFILGLFGLLISSPFQSLSAQLNDYSNIFSVVDQTVLPAHAVHLEGVNVVTSHIDISQAATTGAITIKQNGIYLINYGVEGHLTPPFPFQVPAFSFALTVNNVNVPGTNVANYTANETEVIRPLNGSVQVKILNNQVLRLVNTSTNAVDLMAKTFGSTAPTTSAWMTISLVKSL